MGLLAARLALVDILVLPLETATLLLLRDDLFQNGLFAVLLVETAAVELSCSLDDRADLGESWDIVFRVVLLIMALRIEDISHLE